jgi:succinoglycan biosynthesis protein ExoM
MTTPHITVCVCTFQRPELLQCLLRELERQQTDGRFTFSIVVADNDSQRSARPVADEFAARSHIELIYCHEPRQNVSLARNRAIEHARGDYIAFIDDDEFPVTDWLREMLHTCIACEASGVLGPVRPYYSEPPPLWIVKGGFCVRPEHPTGTVMESSNNRTGNLLFRREILNGVAEPFQPEFGTGGEGEDFFQRMKERGCVFVWCNDALAYEVLQPARWTRSYMLKRALVLGQNSLKTRKVRAKELLTSILAVPAYSLVLPGALLMGQHVFMKYGIKFCDHVGRVLTLFGSSPLKKKWI